jgi:hypothetical protein
VRAYRGHPGAVRLALRGPSGMAWSLVTRRIEHVQVGYPLIEDARLSENEQMTNPCIIESRRRPGNSNLRREST